MTDRRDIVDIAGLRQPPPESPEPPASPEPSTKPTLQGRPWLAILFRCCQVYSRIYRNRQGTAYQGRCPRCQRPLHVPVGPDGTANRFFEAN